MRAPITAVADVEVRAFVAIRLDEAVRAALGAAIEGLRRVARDVAWVVPDNLHLTLKFLGQVRAARTPELVAALTRAASGLAAFEANVAGLGAFPTPTRARVIWAGVGHGTDALVLLASRVDEALAASAGVAPRARSLTHTSPSPGSTARSTARRSAVPSHSARRSSTSPSVTPAARSIRTRTTPRPAKRERAKGTRCSARAAGRPASFARTANARAPLSSAQPGSPPSTGQVEAPCGRRARRSARRGTGRSRRR